MEVLRPVFMALSDSKLLARCVRGATQNRNECINSLVWIRCPKHKFHSAKVEGAKCGDGFERGKLPYLVLAGSMVKNSTIFFRRKFPSFSKLHRGQMKSNIKNLVA